MRVKDGGKGGKHTNRRLKKKTMELDDGQVETDHDGNQKEQVKDTFSFHGGTKDGERGFSHGQVKEKQKSFESRSKGGTMGHGSGLGKPGQ